jgi:hypothetical protein
MAGMDCQLFSHSLGRSLMTRAAARWCNELQNDQKRDDERQDATSHAADCNSTGSEIRLAFEARRLHRLAVGRYRRASLLLW